MIIQRFQITLNCRLWFSESRVGGGDAVQLLILSSCLWPQGLQLKHFPVLHYLLSSPKLTSTESGMPSNYSHPYCHIQCDIKVAGGNQYSALVPPKDGVLSASQDVTQPRPRDEDYSLKVASLIYLSNLNFRFFVLILIWFASSCLKYL